MTEPSHAVFLSYASQDAEAAQRILRALRSAGVEVWFDQSELRGGDAWDQSIRKQIKTCALFLPIISEHTMIGRGVLPARMEARRRSLALIMANRAFLVPVVIDETVDDDEVFVEGAGNQQSAVQPAQCGLHAASWRRTNEAQENVALQVAEQMSDICCAEAISNAVNFPSITAEEAPRLKPFIALAEKLGSFAGQLTEQASARCKLLTKARSRR